MLATPRCWSLSVIRVIWAAIGGPATFLPGVCADIAVHRHCPGDLLGAETHAGAPASRASRSRLTARGSRNGGCFPSLLHLKVPSTRHPVYAAVPPACTEPGECMRSPEGCRRSSIRAQSVRKIPRSCGVFRCRVSLPRLGRSASPDNQRHNLGKICALRELDSRRKDESGLAFL